MTASWSRVSSSEAAGEASSSAEGVTVSQSIGEARSATSGSDDPHDAATTARTTPTANARHDIKQGCHAQVGRVPRGPAYSSISLATAARPCAMSHWIGALADSTCRGNWSGPVAGRRGVWSTRASHLLRRTQALALRPSRFAISWMKRETWTTCSNVTVPALATHLVTPSSRSAAQ